MSTDAIRKQAKQTAASSDNYEVKSLALLVARLCDVVDTHENALAWQVNSIEVEERFGAAR